MIALLVATVVLVIASGWFFAEVLLLLPIYLFHAFDWLFSWIHLFNRVGHWITLIILVSILSWFLEE